jgi:replicative DNA helicase
MNQHTENFAKFGTHFQTKVLQCLLVDVKFFDRIFEILELNFFDSKPHHWLYGRIQKYYEEYKLPPTVDNMEVLVNSENDELMRHQLIEIIRTIKKSVNTDTAFIKDEAIKFCRHMKMKKALYQSIDFWEKAKYDDIYKVLQEAIRAGEESNMGHDYFSAHALEHRIALMKRSPVATGLVHLDEILNGGLSKGELGVVIAPTGLGKSWLLALFGSTAVQKNLKIVHYTFELYDHQVGLRYDTIFTGIPSDKIPGMIDYVKNKLKLLKKDDNLIIKHWPTKRCTINMLRSHLDRLHQQGFIPDLLVIDYADLMKSSQKYEQKRFEQESVYEELRGLAGELSTPIWTASQSNRSSLDSEVVSLASISESFAKAGVADIIITLSRTIEDKLRNTGRLFIAKNRVGKDGIVVPITMNLSNYNIETMKPYESVEELRTELAKLQSLSDIPDSNGGKLVDHNRKKYSEFKELQKKKENTNEIIIGNSKPEGNS